MIVINRKNIVITLIVVFSIMSLGMMISSIAMADGGEVNITGKSYDLGKSSNYDIANFTGTSSSTSNDNTYGKFKIAGDVFNVVNNTYVINDGDVRILYELDKNKINNTNSEWTIIDDGLKEVDGIKLEQKVAKGAIILQTSFDGNVWSTQEIKTNIFGDEKYESELYVTKEIQKINGCHYRVIVAYELEKDDNNMLTINEKKRNAEVYEFYFIDANVEQKQAKNNNTSNTHTFSEPVQKVDINGYINESDILKGDPHYQMKVGEFYVNGFTDKETEPNTGTVVFLKDLGDEVTLWFDLKQDINSLGGNNDLTIAMDKNGYDQYFQTDKSKSFNRGALIIRYTDKSNKQYEPIIYTDFLAAYATMDANTRVKLFKEGDYEVALDYSIKNAKGFDKTTSYRIFFKFKIRNGGCKVFTFDKGSGAELMNNDITSTGFKIDTAKSEYLKVDVTRQPISVDSSGLINIDNNFSERATDQKEYSKEGIYTIVVTNEYTKDEGAITIYVGNSKELLALSKGKYQVDELNEKIREGYSINDDGSLNEPIEEVVDSEIDANDSNINSNDSTSTEMETEKENVPEVSQNEVDDVVDTESSVSIDSVTKTTNGLSISIIIGVLVLGIVGAGGAVFVTKKRGK